MDLAQSIYMQAVPVIQSQAKKPANNPVLSQLKWDHSKFATIKK